MGKSSFILHHDFSETLNKLTDEQAGRLIKAIYCWQLTGKLPPLDITLELVATPLITQFKRDNKKYADISAIRSEAGRSGAKQKLAKAGKKKHRQANASKSADSDNDSGSDSGTSKRFIPPTAEEVKAYMIQRALIPTDKAGEEAERFVDHYTNTNWKIGQAKTKMKSWQAAVRNWEKNFKDRRGKDQTSPVPKWAQLLGSLHGKKLTQDEARFWTTDIRTEHKQLKERTDEEIGNYLCRVIRNASEYEAVPRADPRRTSSAINLADMHEWVKMFARYR